MISIICYGRNDSHGYNLAKRAAMSFNCIAELLDHPDDEIIFVDCNSEDHYATFPESIADTLTPKARRLMRVFRVRRSLYDQRRNGSTLPLLESFSRNVALRRAKPANRWVLSTNPDMVFSLRTATSLSSLLGGLSDGYYAAPRYEVPEALWEDLPRLEPQVVMRTIADELQAASMLVAVRSDPANGFDAPGDFQLLPLQRAIEIGGFHEGMTRGWHVDSNFAKRCSILFGRPAHSLHNELAAFHLMHLRTLSSAHTGKGVRQSNPIDEFVTNVAQAIPQDQPTDWGAPGIDLEEISIDPSARKSFAGYKCVGDDGCHRPDPIEFIDYSSEAGFGRGLHTNLRRVAGYLSAEFQHLPRRMRVAVCSGNADIVEFVRQFGASRGWSVFVASPSSEANVGEANLAASDLVILDFTVHFLMSGPKSTVRHDAPRIEEYHGALFDAITALYSAWAESKPQPPSPILYCIGATHTPCEASLLSYPSSWDAIPIAAGFKRGRLLPTSCRWGENERRVPRSLDDYWLAVVAEAKKFDRHLDHTSGPVETGAALQLKHLLLARELRLARQVILHKDEFYGCTIEEAARLAAEFRPTFSNPVFVLLQRRRRAPIFGSAVHRCEWERLLISRGLPPSS